MGITRSPSATLGVLVADGAPRGPLATFTLAFVMTSDVVVVVVLAVVFTVTRPLLEPGAAFSLRSFQELGHEVLGSVALGLHPGAAPRRLPALRGRQLVLVFVALGLVMTQVLDYLRFDWLLIFITAGFVVQNLSAQGDRFLEEIERLGEIVYVIFFAIAGAHLDLPLLARLWPAALALTARPGRVHVGRGAARRAASPRIRRRSGAGAGRGWCRRPGWRWASPRRSRRSFPAYGAGFARDGGGHGGAERAGRPDALQDRARPEGRDGQAGGAGGGGPGGDRARDARPARPRSAGPARRSRCRGRRSSRASRLAPRRSMPSSGRIGSGVGASS